MDAQDKKIFIVEDERDILELIRMQLNSAGFTAKGFETALPMLNLLKIEHPDLLILDLMLPDIDGMEVCRQLKNDKATQKIPILMLTARTDLEDKIKGLEYGADDYITKPFDSDVLLHKIKAILKRNEEIHKEEANAEFDLGNYHFNPRLRELSVNGKTQTLSPKENELLKMLSEYKNDLLSREIALKKIWGSDTYFNGRSMDVYIAKLRKYLKEDPALEIVNIHGLSLIHI